MNSIFKFITWFAIIIIASMAMGGCGRLGREIYMCKSDIYVVNDIDIHGCPEIFFDGELIDRAVINYEYLESNMKYLEGVKKIVDEQKSVKIRLQFRDKVDENFAKVINGKYRASNEVVKIEIIK